MRQGVLRAREASASGFHLEAISIWEALIWDALNTYVSYRTGKTVNTGIGLGSLEKRLERIEQEYSLSPDEKVLCGLRFQVKTWRKRRDQLLHGLVETQKETHQTFNDRISLFVQYARNGEALFSEIRDLLGKTGVLK